MGDRGEGAGGHIQYEAGISLDDKQREYWSLYTAENREKYFWIFLNSFVEKWEQKVTERICYTHKETFNVLSYALQSNAGYLIETTSLDSSGHGIKNQ